MRWFAIILLILCWWPLAGASAGLSASEAPAKVAEWLQAREQQRKNRNQLQKGAAADRVERAGKAAKIIAELLTKNPGASRSDPDLVALIDGVRYLSPAAAETLAATLASLPEAATTEPKVLKKWTQQLELKRKDVLKPTEKLAQQALAAGVPSVARDCVDQALTFWPDHRDLRRNLGMTLVGGRWYGAHDLELTKQGFAWDDKLGWIVASERARYASGEYYDLQTKTWTTIAAANAARAVAANRWVIQGEHVQVQGTAPLADLVDTVNRLEAFYDRVFAAYSGFFINPGKAGKAGDPDLKLLFGMLDHPRLVINVAKDKPLYQESLPPMVRAGWSDGMFISSTKESYFYSGSTEVIYHEFTHQILHIFTGDNRAPAWLVEGAAVYTQGPQFDGGRMTLGKVGNNSHLQMFIRQSRHGEALTLGKIMSLEDGRMWMNSTTPELNYPAAGAVVQFCMEADERRYRADFLDFLRDSYRGETRGYRLWEYLGLDYSTFETSYADWLNGFTTSRSVTATKVHE